MFALSINYRFLGAFDSRKQAEKACEEAAKETSNCGTWIEYRDIDKKFLAFVDLLRWDFYDSEEEALDDADEFIYDADEFIYNDDYEYHVRVYEL